MRFAHKLDHNPRAHALPGFHANARFIPEKEVDTHEHIGERQTAAALKRPVCRRGCIAKTGTVLALRLVGLRSRCPLGVKQVRDRLLAHANAVVLHNDFDAVIRFDGRKHDG